jgi:uncharacterized coiled-coil DUF342 family protein
MAQPKRDRREISPERQELENLEKKSQMFTQKRNELNDQARQTREERNLLNDRKKEIFDKMNAVRDERDRFNQELQKHKAARNEYQAQAKDLIRKRRGDRKKGQEARSAPMRARELEHEVRELTYKQETSVLKSKEEEKVVKAIREKRRQLKELEPELKRVKELKLDLSDADKAIDTLFAQADEEHEQVVACYKSSQEQHDKYVALVKEVGSVIADANAKHEEFIAIRTRADEQHHKFLELRSKILEIRGASQEDRRAARQMIKEHAKQAREAVADPKKLEEHADRSLEELKKGGRIQIGR